MSFTTACDFCKHAYHHEGKRDNKKKNGYPVFYLCYSCYTWSISKKQQKYAKLLNGTMFSEKFVDKKDVCDDDKQKRQKGKPSFHHERDNEEKKNDEKTHEESLLEKAEHGAQTAVKSTVQAVGSAVNVVESVVETGAKIVVDDVKSAVAVIEAGVSGLLQGASDALNSLTK